jgi:hypothetical protein
MFFLTSESNLEMNFQNSMRYSQGSLANGFYTVMLFIMLFLSCNVSFAQDQKQVPDTTTVQPVFIITPRFNSAGHFPFTGALINRNVIFDLNVFFEYKNYGFFIFKSWDLEDRYSIANYLQPGIFRKFTLSDKLYVRIFFGYVFSQTSGFRDADSDYYTAAVAYWTINDYLKLENTALFFDLRQSAKLANRLLITWQVKSFKIDFYVWQRLVFEDGTHPTSGSIAVNFPRINLSRSLAVQTALSYQGYLTDSKPGFARRDGFLFLIAFPISVIQTR